MHATPHPLPPSPGPDAAVRRWLGRCLVLAALAVGFWLAGTAAASADGGSAALPVAAASFDDAAAPAFVAVAQVAAPPTAEPAAAQVTAVVERSDVSSATEAVLGPVTAAPRALGAEVLRVADSLRVPTPAVPATVSSGPPLADSIRGHEPAAPAGSQGDRTAPPAGDISAVADRDAADVPAGPPVLPESLPDVPSLPSPEGTALPPSGTCTMPAASGGSDPGAAELSGDVVGDRRAADPRRRPASADAVRSISPDPSFSPD